MNNPRHYAMIRNLIIDLCGPLLQIDVNRINERFHQQGISAENPYMTLYREGRVKAFDRGEITPSAKYSIANSLTTSSKTSGTASSSTSTHALPTSFTGWARTTSSFSSATATSSMPPIFSTTSVSVAATSALTIVSRNSISHISSAFANPTPPFSKPYSNDII